MGFLNKLFSAKVKEAENIDIIGIHPIEASAPCHLIELIIKDCDSAVDMTGFTQKIPGKHQSSWQVPYGDKFLNADGTKITGDIMLDGRNENSWKGDVRIAFFFHYLDLGKSLKTPYGMKSLPTPTEIPIRLEMMKYEPID